MNSDISISISCQIIAEFEEDASLYKPSVPEYVPIDSLPKKPDRTLFGPDEPSTRVVVASEADRQETAEPLARR